MERHTMTDNLRTRIAAAIYDNVDDYVRRLLVNPRLAGTADVEGDYKPTCYHLADAVIAVIREANDDIRPTLREALASWDDDADERHHPNCGELSIPDVLYRCQSCGNRMEWCGCRYYCKMCEPAWSKRA